MVTSVDVYKEIRRLQLEGVTSQRRAATLLGISRNTVKKYWEGNAVPWERQTYEREAAVLTPEVVRFIENCLDEYSARDCAARPLKLSIHSGGIEHACRRR